MAMQIAAMRPHYLSRDEARLIWGERAPDRRGHGQGGGQAGPGHTEDVEGRVNAFFKDIVLLDQPSVTDNKTPVGRQLADAGLTIKRFAVSRQVAPELYVR